MKNLLLKTTLCALLLATTVTSNVSAQKKSVKPNSVARFGYGMSTNFNPYISVGVGIPKNSSSNNNFSMHSDITFFMRNNTFRKYSQFVPVNDDPHYGYLLGLSTNLAAEYTFSVSHNTTSIGIGALFAEKVSYSESQTALVSDLDKAVTSTGYIIGPCIKIGKDLSKYISKINRLKESLYLDISFSYIPETKTLRSALRKLDHKAFPVTVGLVYEFVPKNRDR